MNIYAAPINPTTGLDELGTEAHYVEKNTYKSLKTFKRYRNPVKQWPNKVFALYTWSGDFVTAELVLIGYEYNYTFEHHELAQKHLELHRKNRKPEGIGYGFFP